MSLQLEFNKNASKKTLTITADNAYDRLILGLLNDIAYLFNDNLNINEINEGEFIVVDKESLKYCLKTFYKSIPYPNNPSRKNIMDALKKENSDDSYNVVNPEYYNINGLSPIEAFRNGLLSNEEYIGFLKGNIIKYSVRCTNKNKAEDMEKCRTYAEYLREVLQDEK